MADIELVVKIPEEIYKASQIIDVKHEDVIQIPLEVIATGIPLPKGHGRLIDADKIISKICGNSCGCHFEECGHDKPCYSVTRINAAPTIIETDKEQENGNDG